MRYVERHDLLGTRLLTTDAAAGYVILEHYPRAEGVHRRPVRHVPDVGDLRLLQAHPRLARAGIGCSARHDVETIVWPKDSPLGSLLDQSSDWDRVFSRNGDAVWVRSGTN